MFYIFLNLLKFITFNLIFKFKLYIIIYNVYVLKIVNIIQ